MTVPRIAVAFFVNVVFEHCVDHLAVNARLCESWVKFATFSVEGVIGPDVNDLRETVFLRKALRQLQDRRSNIVQGHVGVLLSSLKLRWANSVTTNRPYFLTERCLSWNTAAGCAIIESVNSDMVSHFCPMVF